MAGALHLVGSIPLDTPQEVFETFGAPLGKYRLGIVWGSDVPKEIFERDTRFELATLSLGS